ncbi:MAG: homocysteine S-methyltransferase family protein, partial [Promethearchaeota archaeon]
QDQWVSSFTKQVNFLENGVDLWHIETMSDIEEMVAAIEAIRNISTKPIISSMTYKKTKRGFFTIMGDSLEKCVQIQEIANVDVIGANCTLGSNEMVELIKELKNLTNKPLSAKPNAGQPRIDSNNIAHYDQPIKDFVSDIKEIIQLGAKVVGGCCGTSPDSIREIKKVIDSL